jgi:hypothetical protein
MTISSEELSPEELKRRVAEGNAAMEAQFPGLTMEQVADKMDADAEAEAKKFFEEHPEDADI